MIMEDERAKLYLHAQAYGVDLESAGVVEFTGMAVIKHRDVPRSIAGMALGRSDTERGDLEKKIEIPYRMELVNEALRSDMEERLVALDQGDYIAPVQLNLWGKAVDYFQNRSADFSGFADGTKLEKLGLYNPARAFIRIYSDGEFTLPGKMKREAAAPPGKEPERGKDMPGGGPPGTGSGFAGGTPNPGGMDAT